MGQRLLDQHIDRLVVHHVAALVENAVLTMDGEGIECHVGDDPQLREALTQGAGGALGDAVRVVGFGAVEGLLLQRGHREQRQRRNAQCDQLLGFLQQQVDGQALDARHRRHALALVLAVEDEHREDQVAHRQHVLAHQAPGKLIAAVATQAGEGEGAFGGNETHGALQGPAIRLSLTVIKWNYDR
ncbi:hypothetical protein D3C81_1274110 [compost metagenome]